jgi:Tfp pilus assembly protein PilF
MAVVRHRALVQRALSYFDEQLTADALRDLEAVFAEDPEYPGLETAVMKLRAARGE